MFARSLTQQIKQTWCESKGIVVRIFIKFNKHLNKTPQKSINALLVQIS